MIPALVALGLVLLLVVFAASLYNRLVQLRNRVRNGFAQIDVQLKRRHDLIPNLVETARGYLQHERATLEAVVTARQAAVQAIHGAEADPSDAAAMRRLSGAEADLQGALGRLMVVVEAYPELKADRSMTQLSEELASTENRVAFARQAYNDAVDGYNTACESIPTTWVASATGFRAAAFYEIERPAEREAPRVSFT